LSSKSQVTFYGGVHEIGGNKFLVEDRGTKIFLDFGMQMGKVNQYFAEFVNPRICNGMGDLFEFGLLPKLKGLYRKDYAKHMDFDGNEENEIDAVILSHAHVDHAAYIHYLRPDIPIYCSEATRLIMQAFQDTGSCEEYVIFKENFQIKKNKNGDFSRCKGDGMKYPRNIQVIDNLNFKIDSIDVNTIPIDHSLPGVCGFVIHTSNGSIGYTADIRYHGRRTSDTEKFVENCSESDIDILLCEGTRVQENFSKTEVDVENNVKNIVNTTENLVVCSYPTRDLDRLLSFYNAAVQSGRHLVIDLKQAYILKLFQTSELSEKIYPNPSDKNIKIYLPRKNWGLIDKDINKWTKKLLLEDYDGWTSEFIDYDNAVDYRDVSQNQKEMIFYCSDFQIQQLIDVRPKENSSYIRSSTEPFDDEMELDQRRVRRWLIHFGLINKESEWNHIHVSGHGSGDQIKKVIEESKSKVLIPIHTEHEEYHKKWHPLVKEIRLNDSVNV
jgi:ribonuclease J